MTVPGSEVEWYAEQRAKWTAVASSWHEGEPPAVPSRDDLRAFCDSVLRAEAGAASRIMVMGATVALRRALLTDTRLAQAEIVTVDFSPEMLQVTTAALGADIDLERETRMIGDWRELHTYTDRPVDAIVADKSFDNIAFSDWPAVFDSCAKALTRQGRLALHVGLTDASYESFSPSACLDDWASRVDAGASSLGDAAAGYWEDLLTASAYVGHLGDHELCVGKFATQLRQLEGEYSSNATQGAILTEFNRLFGDSNRARWTAFVLDDVYEQADRWFTPGPISFSNDYAAAPLQPVIELVRGSSSGETSASA